MPKIWRVENKKGKGCYQTKHKLKKWLCCKHDGQADKYPPPICDVGIDRFPKESEICGFKDKKQAIKWFNNYELKKLKANGYELKEVEVEKITAIGEKQILCIR